MFFAQSPLSSIAFLLALESCFSPEKLNWTLVLRSLVFYGDISSWEVDVKMLLSKPRRTCLMNYSFIWKRYAQVSEKSCFADPTLFNLRKPFLLSNYVFTFPHYRSEYNLHPRFYSLRDCAVVNIPLAGRSYCPH